MAALSSKIEGERLLLTKISPILFYIHFDFFFVNIFAHHQLNFSQLNLIVILVATFRVRKIGKPIPKNCVHEDLKHQKGKK